VIKLISYPVEDDRDETILQEIVEEHKRRLKIRAEVKSNFFVDSIGLLEDHPNYGFLTKYYEKGSVYDSLVIKKLKFSDKEIARLAFEVADAVRSLHEQNHLHKVTS
jgi:serine/threonine protein kinase